MREGSIAGVPAKLHFCSSQQTLIKKIDSILEQLKSSELTDIVVLTCKTEAESVLSSFVKSGLYKGKIKFTTCRKFKGLESDAVILVDIEANTFNKDNKLIYYVGASRAKFQLEIVTTMNEDDCKEALLTYVTPKIKKIKNPKREFAAALNANCILEKIE